MIHELRIYTVKSGTVGEVAKNAGEVGRAIRGDDYGKLEGYWMTEIGPLNQVCHLWSYKDLNERARLRGELAKNERWNKEYVPLIRPHLVRQDIRLLNPIVGVNKPASAGNVYEMRYYRLRPGAVKEWVGNFTAALPVREKYSKIVALWHTEASETNEVVHLWAHKNFEARTAARIGSSADPEWQEYVKASRPLIDYQDSWLMAAAPHSPLR